MKMIDALYPDSIPAGTTCDAIAAYIDHDANPQSFEQAVARFPDAIHVKITVKGAVGADVLDCEQSTAESKPSQAIAWVEASRKAGLDPTVYCNLLNTYDGYQPLRAAFAAAGQPEPGWWVADYEGYDPTLPALPGIRAKQFTDRDQNGRNTYDTSSTIDSWPGNGDIMPTAAEIAKEVLDYPVSKDTGTLADTVRDAREIAREAQQAAALADTKLTAALAALAKLQQSVDALNPAPGTAGGDLTKGAQ